MPTIDLTDHTWQRLQKFAIPLEDTPESVIRRLLDSHEERNKGDSSLRGVIQGTPVQPDEGGAAIISLPTILPYRGERTGEQSTSRKTRLKRGVKTNQTEFRHPILEVLCSMGGRARNTAVLDEVEVRMRHLLRPEDLEPLRDGQIRWRNSAAWERNVLVKDGLLKSDSGHGIWELSEMGWAEARKLQASRNG